uniref:Polypeptide N-acetylgalactosaminyltransferase n=1 Tax=Globodera rostochiensis TaxID=31243 RepID=A0A914HXX4_GLORO
MRYYLSFISPIKTPTTTLPRQRVVRSPSFYMKARRLINRYVPKRLLHIILYFMFIVFLMCFYQNVVIRRESAGTDDRHSIEIDDGKDPFVFYRNLGKKDWQDKDAYDSDQKREGNGEQGMAVSVKTEGNETLGHIMGELYRANGYNAYVSDRIALDRSVKDIRHPGCKSVIYLERLPSVSVILPYHDEHFSTLLRSGYSIIRRSPKSILKEIIFVDDASSKADLKEPFEQHWKSNGLDQIVKIVRTTKREGLIRARAIGARKATGEVLVFLDSHSEANYNWLPPLVEPIALDYRTVVCPFVDVIDCDTYEYKAQDEGARGSFDWEFNYKRLPLTEEDKQTPTKPFKSPVMAGGYFAISTKWFWELGGYDEGLDIWGGEQYELSFKVWQCHGQLVDAPCSRVGHIYRCKYIPFGNPGVGDFISRNYRRVAEVWMDEYAEHLYKRRPALRTVDAGIMDRQKAVRERLKCKSFDWFMKEVAFDQDRFYPAIEPPDGAKGELKNVAAQNCVDSGFKGTDEKLQLRKCKSEDSASGGEQEFRLSFWEDIRPKGRTMCFDVSKSLLKTPVVLFACHGMGGNQHFKYRPKSKQLYHKVSNQCMDCDPSTGEVFMNPCNFEKSTQKWEWAKVDENVMEGWEKKAAAKNKGL